MFFIRNITIISVVFFPSNSKYSLSRVVHDNSPVLHFTIANNNFYNKQHRNCKRSCEMKSLGKRTHKNSFCHPLVAKPVTTSTRPVAARFLLLLVHTRIAKAKTWVKNTTRGLSFHIQIVYIILLRMNRYCTFLKIYFSFRDDINPS